ncbi:MAG: hypothetical protein QMD95_00860 [Candidatus Hodarchaeaceae archaeon]|nr:hypothetical protein [Candidatus Hodarchaeaceae archaeon]
MAEEALMTAENKRRAFSMKLERDPTFWACYPHPKFPTVSITGDECALNCKHCGRRYLQQMISCPSPDVLFRTCSELASNGARGALLSGGFNSEGYVPFEPFLDAIEQVKRETRLFISAHTGLAPNWLARELGRVGIDLADFDLIGDDETIELVLGTDRTVEDYRRSLHVLKRSLPHVVPHICIGLHAGEIRGERAALELAAEISPQALVILVLVPTPGTEFECIAGPSPAEVGEFIAEARLKFPEATLALGCMRPRDARRVEIEHQALRAGVDRMELPSEQTLQAAHKLGLRVRRLDGCCAVPPDFVRCEVA